MSAAEELVRICAVLPANKVEELVDFARFLEERTGSNGTHVEESPGDVAWEGIISDSKPRPKLEAFAARALAEEPATPLEGNL